MYNKRKLTLEEQVSLTISHLVQVVNDAEFKGLGAVELTNPAVAAYLHDKSDVLSTILKRPVLVIGSQVWIIK